MRVGYYVKNLAPHEGGAYSLLKKIQDDISSNNDGIEIVPVSDLPYRGNQQGISLYNSKISYFIFRIKRKIYKSFGKQYNQSGRLEKRFKKAQIDILWIPGPFELDVPIPYIFTVWDIGHRMAPWFPEVSNGGNWEARERLYTKMLYKASYIITGNETGKKEILANYPINPEKIRMVSFPNTLQNNDKPLQLNPEIKIETPYIFYPAQFWPHKNHIALVEAMKHLHDNNYVIHCYFTGSDKGNIRYIKEKISEYHLENYIHIMGFVDTGTMVYLYKNALALTFVSLLGPNNLPPIEAVFLGCPVIISNIPGHIEQMEGAALTVDATEPKEIAAAIIKLLENSEFRNTLIEKGNRLKEKQRAYSYYNEIKAILSDFSKMRKTWQ